MKKTHAEKLAIRKGFKDLKEHMKNKPPKYFAWIPMRDDASYFRGIWCEKKKDIEDFFPGVDITKVKYKKDK